MSDLIDRYVMAVAANLPKAERGDIADELREGLEAKRESEEARLGRPMTADELTAMVKAFGNPVAVAGRYRKRQYLIGPEVYPYFLQTLGGVLTVIAVLAVLRSLGAVWEGEVAGAVTTFIGFFWETGLVAALVVILVFATMEVAPGAKALGADWNPRELPVARGMPRRSPGELIWEIAVSGLFLMFWTGVWSVDRTPSVIAADVWQQFYWPVLLVFAGGIVANLLDLLRPRWAGYTAWLNLAVNAASVAIVILLFAARPWIEINPGAVPVEKLAVVLRSADLTIGVIVVIVGLISAFDAWADWKSIRKAGGFRGQATAA